MTWHISQNTGFYASHKMPLLYVSLTSVRSSVAANVFITNVIMQSLYPLIFVIQSPTNDEVDTGYETTVRCNQNYDQSSNLYQHRIPIITILERLEENRIGSKLQLFYNTYFFLDLISRRSCVRLFIPFEMAMILLFHFNRLSITRD